MKNANYKKGISTIQFIYFDFLNTGSEKSLIVNERKKQKQEVYSFFVSNLTRKKNTKLKVKTDALTVGCSILWKYPWIKPPQFLILLNSVFYPLYKEIYKDTVIIDKTCFSF